MQERPHSIYTYPSAPLVRSEHTKMLSHYTAGRSLEKCNYSTHNSECVCQKSKSVAPDITPLWGLSLYRSNSYTKEISLDYSTVTRHCTDAILDTSCYVFWLVFFFHVCREINSNLKQGYETHFIENKFCRLKVCLARADIAQSLTWLLHETRREIQYVSVAKQ